MVRISKKKVLRTLLIYLLFTILFQFFAFISDIATYRSRISWFSLPFGIAYSFFILFSLEIVPIFYINQAIQSLIYSNSPIDKILLVSLYKSLSHGAIIFLVKRYFKTGNNIIKQKDYLIYTFTGFGMSLAAANIGYIFRFRSNITFDEAYVQFLASWTLGDMIGIIMLGPPLLQYIYPYFHGIHRKSKGRKLGEKILQTGYYLRDTIKSIGSKNVDVISMLLLILLSLLTLLSMVIKFQLNVDIYYIILLPMVMFTLMHGSKGSIYSTIGLNLLFLIMLVFFIEITEEIYIIETQIFIIIANFSTSILGIKIEEERIEAKNREKIENYLFQMRKIEAIGRTTGKIAHDFKNIIQVLHGQTEIIEISQSTNEQSREIKVLKEHLKRANEKVNQLIKEPDDVFENFPIIDLNEIVREENSTLDAVLKPGVVLEVNMTSEPCISRLNKEQMGELLLNMVMNANAAINNRGKIKIKTKIVSYSETKYEYFAVIPSGKYIQMDIVDEGIGMTEEELSHAFEPFYTTKEDGSGWGLTSVFSIVRAHQAHVSVNSLPGKGTNFHFWFKLCNAEIC